MSKPTYIRAKREKSQVFLCIDPQDSLDHVKTKLCKAFGTENTCNEVRLLVDGKKEGEYTVLESAKALENNGIVYFVFLNKENDQWETVNIVEPVFLDDEEMEEQELPVKKEKGKGRA